MKYVSIDIETTGLDPNLCQIIEFAVVAEDTNQDVPVDALPSFRAVIEHHTYAGEPYALAMHAELFSYLAKPAAEAPRYTPYSLVAGFTSFLVDCGFDLDKKVIVAGKNFAGFDLRFLRRLHPWFDNRFSHRVIDPAMLWLEPGDAVPPNLDQCLARACIGRSVTHRALDDARDVVRVVRAGLTRLHAAPNGAVAVRP